MKELRIPLFAKFIFLFTFIAIVPLITISIITSKINQEALQTPYFLLYEQIIKNLSENIDNFFNSLKDSLQFVEDVISRTDTPWESKQSTLQSLLNVNRNIISISIIGADGKEKTKIYNPDLETSPHLIDYSKNITFQRLKDTKDRSLISNIFIDQNIPKINSFYKENNFFINVTLTPLNLFEQIKNRKKVGKTDFISIIDIQTNKVIFTDTDSTTYLQIKDNEPDNKLNFEEILKIIGDVTSSLNTITTKIFTQNKKDYIATFIYNPTPKWIILLQQEKDEAYKSTTALLTQTRNLIILAVLLATIAAFLIARNISKPILNIINAAKEVANGNFKVKIKIKTFDELELLGKTFNQMSEKLDEYAEIQLDKLIAEKTKTEAIVFSIEDGIILTNYQGDILLINKKAKEILNINDENLENKNILNLINANLRPVIESTMQQPHSIKEINISTESSVNYYQTSSVPVTTLKNEKIGIVTVLHDITLEKEIEKLKEDFLHSITHDLRNPMTSIRGFIKFLLEGIAGQVNDQQKKMLETMDRASYRLLGMINDILDIAKLEAGKMDLLFEKSDLVKIVKYVIEVCQPQIDRKKLNINLSTSENEIFANVDPRLIERVYSNLIGNAIKFTPENGNITIEIKQQNNIILSSVQDNGEGIPAEYLNTIFEKFGQVKNKSKGGTGLGLTICKYVVEAHKGKIWVESEVGKGAKFYFEIPRTI